MRRRTLPVSPMASLSRRKARATNRSWRQMARPSCISVRMPPRARKATGSRLFPARAILRSSGSTARPRPPSIRAGSPATSRRSNKRGQPSDSMENTMKRHLTTLRSATILTALCLATLVHEETVDTRIGKLEIENGYPSKATAVKLFDQMDFQLSTHAYIWALPAVGFHGLHQAHLNTFGAKDGEVVLYRDLKDKAGMLTPNLTTLYLMSFWNLAEQGPLVVEVPGGAPAGTLLAGWQRALTD